MSGNGGAQALGVSFITMVYSWKKKKKKRKKKKAIHPYNLEEEIRTCGPSNNLTIPNKVISHPEYYNKQFRGLNILSRSLGCKTEE